MPIQGKFVATVILFCSCAFSQGVDLSHGKFELRGFGGGVYAGNLFIGPPALLAGVEGAVGLNRIVAVTGQYAFDHLGTKDSSFCFSSACSRSRETGTMHEFMGGFRVSAPNRTRLTPYGAIGVGVAALTNNFTFTSPGFSTTRSNSGTKFAAQVGAGAAFRISRRTGINVDVRGVAVSFGPRVMPGWIVRPTGGFYFRF